MRVRLARPDDASAIAAIYNQGIEERGATFETQLRSDEDVLGWFDGVHPIVVVHDPAHGVIAFARTSAYSERECYGGVFEFAVYTDFSYRRRGAGILAMRELVTHSRNAGAWKLVSRVFVDNNASRMLLAALGFREVGIHHRHAKLDGEWRDVVVVEKFLAPATRDTSIPPPPSRAPRSVAIASLRSEQPSVRLHALESARSLLDVYRRVDRELLDAAADALFATHRHDAAARARFVELFRAYGALSREAAQEVDEALFSRLGRLSISIDLDAFYEATFVVKQVVSHASDASRGDLAAYRPLVLGWLKQTIELPRTTRSRISPGNVTSLLLALALASSESEEQKKEIADLAAEAKERHRVEAPTSMRPSQPPPPPAAAPPPPAAAPPEPAPPPPPPSPLPASASAAVVENGAPPVSAKKPRKKRAPANPDAPKKRRTKRA